MSVNSSCFAKQLSKYFWRWVEGYERTPFMSGYKKVFYQQNAEVEILENKAAYKVTPHGEESFEISVKDLLK